MFDRAQSRATRDLFRYFISIPTRWMDSDIYGHVNNVVYYAYFDTLICRYLMEEAKVDIVCGPLVPFTVENRCRYHRSLSFPAVVEAGLRVARIGNSSVHYEIALFSQGDDQPAAEGYFIDVFVDRATHGAITIPDGVRAALEKLKVE
ncbi:MAG: acyl-CoA thioesterase [Acidiferrobacterales bacterium]